MSLSNIFALRKRSDEVWSQRCLWSSVKIQGTIFAEIFLISKSSFTICRTVPLFIFSSAITLTPTLRCECTEVRTLSTFASVLCIFGCPLLGPSFTSRPSFNSLCHSKTLYFFIAHMLCSKCENAKWAKKTTRTRCGKRETATTRNFASWTFCNSHNAFW
jgi:hypothetical protein